MGSKVVTHDSKSDLPLVLEYIFLLMTAISDKNDKIRNCTLCALSQKRFNRAGVTLREWFCDFCHWLVCMCIRELPKRLLRKIMGYWVLERDRLNNNSCRECCKIDSQLNKWWCHLTNFICFFRWVDFERRTENFKVLFQGDI